MPVPGDMRVVDWMSNISLATFPKDYIGFQVFPVVPVVKRSDKILKFDKNAFFRAAAQKRAAKAATKFGDYMQDTGETYYCDEWTHGYLLADEEITEAAQGSAPLKPYEDAVDYVTLTLLNTIEQEIASLVCTAGNWTNKEDAEGLWAAGESNTFITDMFTRLNSQRTGTGMRPNTLLMDEATLNQLKQEADILDRIKYTERGIVTADLIAAIFDLDQVIVAKAVKTTAKETKATGTFTGADLWAVNAGHGFALLYYKPPAPSRKTPCTGCVFTRVPDSAEEIAQAAPVYAAGQSSNVFIRTWREEAEHSDAIEAVGQFDPILTDEKLGFLWYDTILT